MDKFIRLAPTHNVLYLCVDGLHVTKQGYLRLMAEPEVANGVPGSLRVDGIADCAVYRGLYDYSCGDKNVHAGIPKLLGLDGLPVTPRTLAQKDIYADTWDRSDPLQVLAHATGPTRARYEGVVRNDGWIAQRTLHGHDCD